MPTRPLKPCPHPGCASLVDSGYCDAHRRHTARAMYDATTRRNDPALARNRAIRDSVPMRKVAALHKRMFPICCDPFGDHKGWPVPTQQSHHIKPLLTHPELALDMDNLAAVCIKCHNKAERMEQQGPSTCELFYRAKLKNVDRLGNNPHYV